MTHRNNWALTFLPTGAAGWTARDLVAGARRTQTQRQDWGDVWIQGEISDFKLKSQFRDAAQSVSANISEGYGRRSLPEYLQYLYISKGSLAEALTRAIGFWAVEVWSAKDFDEFDKLHYEVENKLLRLIESLEAKRQTNDWRDTLPSTNPSIHKSNYPPLPE